MKKYCTMPEKATVNVGNSSITVYGDTARFVNTLVSVVVVVSLIALLSKIVK